MQKLVEGKMLERVFDKGRVNGSVLCKAMPEKREGILRLK